MQKNQQLVVALYALIFLMMFVCPPWNCIDRGTKNVTQMGYGPFWQPPVVKEKLEGSQTPGNPFQPYVAGYIANEVDMFRLIVQIVLLTVSCGVIFTMAYQKPAGPRAVPKL